MIFTHAILQLFLLLILLSGNGATDQQGVPAQKTASVGIGPSYRIHPSNNIQTETFIVRHPSNPNILLASANTVDPSSNVSEGIYVTTNGGISWYGNDTCNGAPIPFHRGDPGIAIDKNGRFLLVRLGFSDGLYSHYSTDNGVNWSNQVTIGEDQQDRAALVSDGNPASTFYGRSYAAWVRFASPYRVHFSFSNNGGQTWSTPAPINNPTPTPRSQGGDLAMGPNGTVNACWARVINTSPFTEDFAGFASSTNGGTTWTVVENAFDMNGIAGLFPEKGSIRVNGSPRLDVDKTGGPRNGWIYVTTSQKNLPPAGSDYDVIMNRSTDGGLTWSPGIRVNQDPSNNGKFQYFPAVHVDDFGGLNILYYDDRNTTTDSATVFLSRSLDGGNTWTDYRIAHHNFKPLPIISTLGQGYQGDNIGLTSTGTTLWPVWMDNSTGIYQIWICEIDLRALSAESELKTTPAQFELYQNYPNPFNSSTVLTYALAREGYVNLRVIDLQGREIATLVDDRRAVGSHSVVFTTEWLRLASGIYFYQLTVSGSTLTKRMLLVK